MYNNRNRFQVKGEISFEDDEDYGIRVAKFHLIIPPLNIDKIIQFEQIDYDIRINQDSLDYLDSKYKGMKVGLEFTCSEDERLPFMEIRNIDECFELPWERIDDSYGYVDLDFNIVFLDKMKKSFKTMVGAASDLGKMFHEEKFTDVTIKCNEGDLKSHKLILSARSLVFEKMFYTDTLESKTGVVNCSFDLHIMQDLLEYIYSDNINKSNPKQLYEAADYYELPYLMERCVNILKKSLNPTNAKLTAKFADTYNEQDLKKEALNLIKIFTKKKKCTAGPSAKKKKTN